ncbi:MAG: thiopurine S-methyltransferase [Gammaproteobacteria bacterium]|nr:thiopurine S-methyltransferase [Gammaproteobacteria bacterium]
MDPTFWHARWQQGQIGFHRQDYHPKLERWWPQLELPPGARVLAPLCGKSLDLRYLAGRGHEVIGCELSPLAAEAFFAEAGLAPERSAAGKSERWSAQGISILVGDFFDLQASDTGPLQAFYDRAALVALPSALRRDYATRLATLMPAGTAGLLLALDYPDGALEGPPFSVDTAEVHDILGPNFTVESVQRNAAADVPAQLRAPGASTMYESVYRLTRR